MAWQDIKEEKYSWENWEHFCCNCDHFPGIIPTDYDGECPYVDDFFNGKKFGGTDWTTFNCPKFCD